MRKAVAEPLNLSIEDAAEAILRVANAKMAGAIRLVSIERGYDPAKFSCMPFGGGGALHSGALIDECGLQGALVPRYPGVTSALGCVVADMRHDRVKTVNSLLSETDATALGEEMQAVAGQLSALLDNAGVAFSSVDRIFELDMLYLGQTHTLTVALEIPPVGLNQEVIQTAFEQAYLTSYARLLPGNPTRVMNFRVAVVGRRPVFDMSVFAPRDGKAASVCLTGSRPVYVGGCWQDAGIYDRLSLAVGEQVTGPCILEQSDTTIFVDPNLSARVDSIGNLIIERQS